MAEEAKAPADWRNPWGGIVERSSIIILSSNYQSIFSSNQYYTHMKVEKEKQKTVAGVESDWDPRPLASI